MSLLDTLRSSVQRKERHFVDPTEAAAIGGAAISTILGQGLLANMAMRGTVSDAALAAEKAKNTRMVSKLLKWFKAKGVEPSLHRTREFDPMQAHADPFLNEAHLSYYSHPAIVAHELGHLSNAMPKSLLGKILQGVTNLSYSPIAGFIPFAGSMAAYATGHDEIGDPLLASQIGLQGLKLVEEGRASSKALKALRDVRGASEMQDLAPLVGGFGTYLLGAMLSVGIPLAAKVLTKDASVIPPVTPSVPLKPPVGPPVGPPVSAPPAGQGKAPAWQKQLAQHYWQDQQARAGYRDNYLAKHPSWEQARDAFIKDKGADPNDLFGDKARFQQAKPLIQQHISEIMQHPQARNMAWLMTQHMDADAPHQQWFLDQLEQAGHAGTPEYNYLTDRVAVNAGKPQQFGTQKVSAERRTLLGSVRRTRP